MKNKILLSGVLVALCVLPFVSLAEEGSVESRVKVGTSTEARLKAKAELEAKKKELEDKKESIKSEIESKREALKEEVENRKDSIKNSVEERRQNAVNKIKERIDQFLQDVAERFEAAINRLEKLSDRISSRINKLEAEKIDVSKAKELLIIAKAKIDIAKTSAGNITIASSTATTTVALKESFKSLKTIIETAKKDIKAAHAALIDVVKNLKPGRNNDKTATTTSATSTDED